MGFHFTDAAAIRRRRVEDQAPPRAHQALASIQMELIDGRLCAEFRLHIPEGEEPGPAGSGFMLTPVNDAQADRVLAYFEAPTTMRSTFLNRTVLGGVPIPRLFVDLSAPAGR
jgi:hypothetical protein